MSAAVPVLVETLANQFFQIRDLPDTDHCWMGIEVKRVKGGFALKAKAREILVRKLGTRVAARAGTRCRSSTLP